MTGLCITLADGIPAPVAEIRILDTYAGQLAGTMTVGTRHQILAYAALMDELESGKRNGYYYIPPELVDEVDLRGIPDKEAERIRLHTELGKCLKEEHLIATLHIPDKDFCHIIDVHWFQTGQELAWRPLASLIQDAVGRLSSKELLPFCEHVDWLDMY